MVNKNQPLNATQFILALPIEEVRQRLTSHPQLAVRSLVTSPYLEVTPAKAADPYPVYVALKSWNGDETLVTLTPNMPLIQPDKQQLLIMGGFAICVALVLVFLKLYIFAVAMIVMVGAFYIRLSNRTASSNTVDAETLSKEKLINKLVTILTHNVASQPMPES